MSKGLVPTPPDRPHGRLSFLSTFFGYHQIFMVESNQEKTSFIMNFRTYCYTVMPFGLKNIGETHQRIVNSVFHELIRNVIEAYIDDMVVKSTKS